MDKNEIMQRINEIVHADIGIDPATIDPDQPIRDQVCLDSMQFIGLIAKLEIELSLELPMSLLQVTTLREFHGEIGRVLKQ